MRTARPNWWLGLALLAVQIPRAEAAPTKGTSSPPAPEAPAHAPAATNAVPAARSKSANGSGPASGTAIAKKAPSASSLSSPVKASKGDLENKNATKAKPVAPSSRPTKTASAAARASTPRPASEGARRSGALAEPDVTALAESPELRALREADRELFRAGAPAPAIGSNELPGPLPDPSQPLVSSSGLAPTPALTDSASGDTSRDLSWLRTLALPDMPARWDPRVVRYLSYYHDEPRGRSLLQGWVRKSGRYGATIRRVLRDRGLPDDLVWVALVESGFDPAIRSSAGAAGLWQLMPEGAKAFGLSIDRWIDERCDAERATEVAARYLADLYRRVGTWELALAAYNMGYGALLNAIRKYNTNDFWELTKYESGVPYETALYVPKIIAVAVAARNPAAFGLDNVRIDPPLAFDPVVVPAGTTVATIAAAAGVSSSVIEGMNPQIRRGRTPPLGPSSQITAFTVRVPQGKGIAVTKKFAPRMPKERDPEPEEAASPPDTAVASAETAVPEPDSRRPDDPAGHDGLGFLPNAMPSATAMLPPIAPTQAPAPPVPPAAAEKTKISSMLVTDEKPVVVHPADPPRFAGRTRVFYRVVAGDTLRDIATSFRVAPDDLARWNPLDPAARLQEGMTLQVFVKDGTDLSRVEHLGESDVRCLTVGSDEFFAYFESLRGRKRTTIVVEEGETWERLAKRFNLTLGQLERINQRSRFEKLAPKETLVVYAPAGKNVAHEVDAVATGPAALGPVVAPNPEDLPELPEPPDMETSDTGADEGFGASAQSRRLTR